MITGFLNTLTGFCCALAGAYLHDIPFMLLGIAYMVQATRLYVAQQELTVARMKAMIYTPPAQP